MRKLTAIALAGLLLAGCETCQTPSDVTVAVGGGTSGVSGGVSVGKSCGPGYVAVGFGNGLYLGW